MSLVIVFLTHNFHPSINMMIYIVPQEKKKGREKEDGGRGGQGRRNLRGGERNP